jgi:hypothetical protein
VKELDSDIVVLVGDIFDTNKRNWPDAVTDCVAELANRKGIFYVTVCKQPELFFLVNCLFFRAITSTLMAK